MGSIVGLGSSRANPTSLRRQAFCRHERRAAESFAKFESFLSGLEPAPAPLHSATTAGDRYGSARDRSAAGRRRWRTPDRARPPHPGSRRGHVEDGRQACPRQARRRARSRPENRLPPDPGSPAVAARPPARCRTAWPTGSGSGARFVRAVARLGHHRAVEQNRIEACRWGMVDALGLEPRTR